jgi:hypothetical protein
MNYLPTAKPILKPPTHPLIDLMQFQSTTASELIANLISTNSNIEIRQIAFSSHIMQCAALFSQGCKLGMLYKKGPDNKLLKDASGNYIPTDSPVPLIPNEGIILLSGNSEDFYCNSVGTAAKYNAGGNADLKRSVDESKGKNNNLASLVFNSQNCQTQLVLVFSSTSSNRS